MASFTYKTLNFSFYETTCTCTMYYIAGNFGGIKFGEFGIYLIPNCQNKMSFLAIIILMLNGTWPLIHQIKILLSPKFSNLPNLTPS